MIKFKIFGHFLDRVAKDIEGTFKLNTEDLYSSISIQIRMLITWIRFWIRN